MPPHPQKTAEMLREERRKTVAANLLAGLTYRQICEALHVSLRTVHLDVKIILKRWQTEQVQLVDEQKQLERQRLDMALNAIWAKVLSGDESSIDRYLGIVDKRARLFGWYAPTKVAPTMPDGETPYDAAMRHADLVALAALLGLSTEQLPPSLQETESAE